jgi:hypothetical protein
VITRGMPTFLPEGGRNKKKCGLTLKLDTDVPDVRDFRTSLPEGSDLGLPPVRGLPATAPFFVLRLPQKRKTDEKSWFPWETM